MKITRADVPFVPIIISLESADEVDAFMSIMRFAGFRLNGDRECDMMRQFADWIDPGSIYKAR